MIWQVQLRYSSSLTSLLHDLLFSHLTCNIILRSNNNLFSHLTHYLETTKQPNMPSLTPTHLIHRQHCACKQDTTIGPAFSPILGLRFQYHDAWLLAKQAAASFNGTQPLGMTQQAAITRWRSTTPAFPNFSTVLDAFSDIFFLGQLPTSQLKAEWRNMPSRIHGYNIPSNNANLPDKIYVNCARIYLRYSSVAIIRVLLHEAAHAFFSRYARHERRTRSSRGMFHNADLGITGHGRAWQYLVKSIEERMGELLDLHGSLGRDDGFGHELLHGGRLPCWLDVCLLYGQFRSATGFLKLVRVKDDVDVKGIEATGRVEGNPRPVAHTGRRRRRRSCTWSV